MKKAHQNQNKHIPVLLESVLKYLDPKPGDSYLDLTAGYGGHAHEVLERTLSPKKAVLVDRDKKAVSYLRKKFVGQGVKIINKDYLSATEDLLKKNEKYELILADLGVSSPHLNEASRGFSILANGPLDMRMDQNQILDAYAVVNSYSEEKLAKIIKQYGEDPKAWQIARLIVKNRPIRDTNTLATVVKHAWPGHSRVHPATKTFQAIRIAVNDELDQLEKALPMWIDLLSPGGRLVVVSFHSLEDRVVKNLLKELGGDQYDSILRVETKKPIEAQHYELVSNPRARSAKLRAAVKIKTERGSVNNAHPGKEPLPGV
jgi:16S rRNA (cytosine1402-N4)-methyltransferase